jgi:hypothetical protein
VTAIKGRRPGKRDRRSSDRRTARRRTDDARALKVYTQQKEREHREFVSGLLEWNTSTLLYALITPDIYDMAGKQCFAIADELNARIPRRTP